VVRVPSSGASRRALRASGSGHPRGTLGAEVLAYQAVRLLDSSRLPVWTGRDRTTLVAVVPVQLHEGFGSLTAIRREESSPAAVVVVVEIGEKTQLLAWRRRQPPQADLHHPRSSRRHTRRHSCAAGRLGHASVCLLGLTCVASTPGLQAVRQARSVYDSCELTRAAGCKSSAPPGHTV